MKYQLLRRLLRFNPTYDLIDGRGRPILCAEKRLVSFSSEYSARSPDGRQERFSLRQRYALGRPDYEVAQGGEWLAFIQRRLSFYPSYDIDLVGGEQLHVISSTLGRRYHIAHADAEDQPLATISRGWTLRERYRVELLERSYEEVVFAIALVIADSLRHSSVG
ncbi:hypothetical protein MalM25_25040 [Planctomycetes bacterium MalM25]|nr:hypothetical protein MalM25_25040 [Planctomycetes bacterium MalM25]